MAYASAHKLRWERYFGDEPWWADHLALYEYLADKDPGGVEQPLEELVYALARARGIDSRQTCPSCKKTVEQATSLDGEFDDRWSGCEACRTEARRLAKEAEKRHEEERKQQVEAERRYQEWFASLTPEQQAFEQERRAEALKPYLLMVNGLITRDVQ